MDHFIPRLIKLLYRIQGQVLSGLYQRAYVEHQQSIYRSLLLGAYRVGVYQIVKFPRFKYSQLTSQWQLVLVSFLHTTRRFFCKVQHYRKFKFQLVTFSSHYVLFIAQLYFQQIDEFNNLPTMYMTIFSQLYNRLCKNCLRRKKVKAGQLGTILFSVKQHFNYLFGLWRNGSRYTETRKKERISSSNFSFR